MIVLRKGKGKEREPQFSDGVNLVSGSIEGGFFFAAGVFSFPILIFVLFRLIHRASVFLDPFDV
jgi:hypothetical protein